LFTTTQGLAGSVSENCPGRDAAADGGTGACDGGSAAAVVLSAAVGEGPAEITEGADDDGATALGASGVHAVNTVSPAPAARNWAKDRRLVPGG
jgi:hypothetical protein